MENKKIDIQPKVPIKVPVISVLGGPGSGKGTLCQLIAKHYGLFHVSVGDLLREEAKSGSHSSPKITRAMKAGENIDVSIVLRILEKKILQNNSYKGYLLDGFPRDAKHGLRFEEEIAPIKCILLLQASTATLKKRLLKRAKSSNRIDDNMITINKRLSIYSSSEAEILKAYESKIYKIPCEKPVKDVFNSSIAVLNGYFVPKQK